MSQISEIQVQCAHCQLQYPLQIWDSVNVTLNPEMKKQVIYGDIFRTECPYCHEIDVVEYPIIYHDMEKKIMIAANPMFSQEEIRAFSMIMQTELPPDYRIRLVTSVPDLMEKANILDCGYDDRLIEMMKLYIMGELVSEGMSPEMEIRFGQEEGEEAYFLILLPDSMPGEVPFSPDMYHVLEEVFQTSLIGNTDTFINAVWANNFVMSHADMT